MPPAAPWGLSHQWADSSLRLHTFATVMGLALVSLARLRLGTRKSARSMLQTLSEVKATLVRVRTKQDLQFCESRARLLGEAHGLSLDLSLESL